MRGALCDLVRTFGEFPRRSRNAASWVGDVRRALHLVPQSAGHGSGAASQGPSMTDPPFQTRMSFDCRRAVMPYSVKPLGCDPARVKGMSERLIISHYENNYGGAVKRLNLIEEKLAELDYANAPGFLVNGLKREELIAMNSMILHELFFEGLGEQSEPGTGIREALARDFGSYERWHAEFVATGKALGGGSGW